MCYSATLFCEKLSAQQYKTQQIQSTESAIVSLVQSIVDNTKMSIKEKQKHIKAFNKHHKELMLKYFKDIAWVEGRQVSILTCCLLDSISNNGNINIIY